MPRLIRMDTAAPQLQLTALHWHFLIWDLGTKMVL